MMPTIKWIDDLVAPLVLWLSILVLVPGAVASDDVESGKSAPTWPMFRGNQALTGVASGTLPDKPSMLWKFKTGGPVKSSAAIVDGRVFIGADDGKLYALNLADGRKLWEFTADGPIESSPLVLGGKVYFGSAGTGTNLFAVDTTSGKKVWSYGIEAEIKSSPNWVRSPDGKTNWILVGGYDNRLHCLDAGTGKTNWVYETGNYINGSPAVFDGKTVFGGCDAILHVLSLADGQKVKEVEAGAYIAASGAVDGNRIYIGHYENEFICVDLAEGKRNWTYKDRAFPYFASPALAKDRVVFGGRDKRLHCAKRENGEVIWTFNTQGKVDSSPVIVGEKVVVGSDDGRLYIVSLKDGKELWHYEIGQAVGSSPAVVDGRIVVGSDDGGVYCFGTKR